MISTRKITASLSSILVFIFLTAGCSQSQIEKSVKQVMASDSVPPTNWRGRLRARPVPAENKSQPTQPDDPDFVTIKNVPLRFDTLGMTTTYVEERKREGRWTQYRTRYDVDLLDPNGSAAKAGIRSADSIVFFNHQTFGGETSLETYLARVPDGGTVLLGVRPHDASKNASIEVTKTGSPSAAGPMVRMTRTPAEVASLMGGERTFDPRTVGTHRLNAEEFTGYINKTLYFRNYPYKTILEMYFSDNGVVGMKYNIGAYPKKYCGKWWIDDEKVCFGVLGARAGPVCYEPVLDRKKNLIFVDNDPNEPERYELTKSDAGDSLGYGAGSRRAFDEYLQVSAREDQRLQQYAQAHDLCEQRRSAAIVDNRAVRVESPSSVYDRCMDESGFSMGLFSALSQRTAMAAFEVLFTGQSSLGQCTF